jgi:hypothetical protein
VSCWKITRLPLQKRIWLKSNLNISEKAGISQSVDLVNSRDQVENSMGWRVDIPGTENSFTLVWFHSTPLPRIAVPALLTIEIRL